MPTVSDTSPISNLAYIGRLDLLREQFSELFIPQAVQTELLNLPVASIRKVIDDAKRAGWLKVQPATNTSLITLLMVELHADEAEAIALALEMKADRLLLDERDGRAVARHLGLPTTGALGVLLRAKKTGRIHAIKPEIATLRRKAGFFIGPALEAAILTEAGE